MSAHPFAELLKWFPDHCDSESLDLMYRHWQLVLQWNARTNLTAIKSDQEALLRHYADSLVMAEYLLRAGRVLDVGSGGGFPGIPLAIVRQDLDWVLLEPRKKRVSFLQMVKARLQLSNVEVVNGRSDQEMTHLCDAAVTRATFSDEAGARSVMDWVKPGGYLLALRSLDAESWQETDQIKSGFGSHVRRIDRLR